MASLKEWLAFLVFFIAIAWAAAVGGFIYAFIIILISAIWIYTDAKKYGLGPAPGEKQELGQIRTWTPGTWAILVIIFWIVFFPLYLWKKDDLVKKG